MIVQDFIMFVDDIGDESPTTTAHNPIGNIDLTVSITNHQELEYNYIHNRLREIKQFSSSSSQLSSQEYTAIAERLHFLQNGTDVNEIN